MSFLSYLLGRKQPSAQVAKERLQIILAHERNGRTGPAPDYLPALKEELIAVISKYISVDKDDIKVSLEKQDDYEVLELNILLPETTRR
ncbi:cell division topological specificity factor MinE [Chitinivorax sp. B]|uniref:cell division topological specificity factor MinE n=1 Tax=Chitinivorax sp. B TaxID=2502235 RepID=UPI0010F58119|nr:cell division topological specificity factor MinE [Chitinivorax sp. B]